MSRKRTLALMVLAVTFTWGCAKDSTAPSTLISDPQVTADVAASSGEAAATDVAAMIGDEVSVALPTPGLDFGLFGSLADSIAYSRTRTCYDSTATAIPCSPLSAVRSIVFHVTFTGTRTGTLLTTAVHRVRDWTLTRLFTAGVETARRHDGVGTASDTSVFDNPTTQVTRTHDLNAVDSAVAVVFDLPRSTNPWPVSGMWVRHVAVHATFTSPTQSATRDYTKRIEVDFPADAQGNVVLKIDSQTCNLNLVTRAVTNGH